MSGWNDKTEVKKGNIGEDLVRVFLKKKNYILYLPDREAGAHVVDGFAFNNEKMKIIGCEIKTKPKREYYPDTGFDIRSYDIYKKISEKHNLKIFCFFVDEKEQKIYGNYLDVLDKQRIIKRKVVAGLRMGNNGEPVKIYKTEELDYPIRAKGIIYFPREVMKIVDNISDEDAEMLKKYSTRNPKYDEEKK